MATLIVLAMAAFVLVCLAVGFRLLALARKTRALPEAAMGIGFLLIGGMGYGLVAAAGWAAKVGSPGLPWFWGGSLLAVSSGCVCVAFFTGQVFRPDGRGRALFIGLVLATFGGWLGHGLSPGFDRIGLWGPWAWLGFAGRVGCLGWAAVESLRYSTQVRRQLRIGLGDREVGERCMWWGVGAGAACGVFLRNGLAQFLGHVDFTAPSAAIPTVMLGLIASGAIWRAFFVHAEAKPEVASPPAT
ncbi:MAG: hypothetical protein GY937_29215 [bacterium]|nr:hypothetical protein [bacterium]